jgi:DNA helicase-2/ATP-dependent DNA helicase PcrA
VSRASWRLPEELAAQRSIKGHVDVLDYDTFSDAADAAAERVKEIVAEGGNYKDFVVIYRTNVQSRPYEQAFFEAKIPFVVKSGYSFYDRAEVRNLLAYLRVAFGLDQTIASIGYCINTPSRFLGKVFTGHVKDLKIDEPSLTWGEAVRAVAQSKDLGLKARQRDKAVEFYLVLKALGESKLDVQPLLRWLVQKLDYLEEVDKKVADIEDADNYPSHNVLELINVAGQFKDVKSFLAFVDEQIDIAHRFAKDEEPDAVVLATIHRVKGLEFKEVWFTGCQKGILPHVKSANPMDEELRLFYVGVTRAKDVLSCVWVRESPAYVKSQKGSNENAIGGPSPFLYSSGLLEYPPTPEPQPTTANLRPA